MSRLGLVGALLNFSQLAWLLSPGEAADDWLRLERPRGESSFARVNSSKRLVIIAFIS